MLTVTDKLTEQIDQATRIARAYERGRRLLRSLESEGVAALRSLLVDLRREITARINSVTAGPRAQFTADLAAQIEADIREALNFVTRNATASVRSTLERAFDAGSRITPTALGAGGVNAAFPTVAPAILTTLSQATEIALTELVSRLDQQIVEQLRLSAIGLEPTSGAVRRIENLLRTSREVEFGRRLRTGFASQAEAIVRTEINRMYQSAQSATSSILGETIPGLRKRWVTTLGKRRGHREAEARYAPGGEVGPIPVNDRFRVTDFSRSDRNVAGFWTTRTGAGFQRVYKGKARARSGSPITDRMLHPLDPTASPGNVLFCTCIILEVLPGLESAQQQTLGILQGG